MDKEKRYFHNRRDKSSKLRTEISKMHNKIECTKASTAKAYDRVAHYCWVRHQMIFKKTRYDNPLYYQIIDCLAMEDYLLEIAMNTTGIDPFQLLSVCFFASSLRSEKALYIRNRLANYDTFYFGRENNCREVSLNLEKRIQESAKNIEQSKTATERSGHRLLWFSLREERAAFIKIGRWDLPNSLEPKSVVSKSKLLNEAMDITAGRIEEYQLLYRKSLVRVLQSATKNQQQFYAIRTAISLQGLLKHNIELKLQYIKDGVWLGKSYEKEISQIMSGFIENFNLLDPVITAALHGEIVPSIWGLLENTGALYFSHAAKLIMSSSSSSTLVGDGNNNNITVMRGLVQLNEKVEKWIKGANDFSKNFVPTHHQNFLWTTASLLLSIEYELFRGKQESTILVPSRELTKLSYSSKSTFVPKSDISETLCCAL